MLSEKLVVEGDNFAEAWNFGPHENSSKPVSWVIDYLSQKILNVKWELDKSTKPHETNLLLLDSSKAKSKLNWSPTSLSLHKPNVKDRIGVIKYLACDISSLKRLKKI